MERKTWNEEEYAKKAAERKEREDEEYKALEDGGTKRKTRPEVVAPAQREKLQARDRDIDFRSGIGKSHVITDLTPRANQGGFYCEVCDSLVKDSLNWVDHINGKKHQRALGFTMKTERSSVSQVRDRLKMHKRKQTEEVNKQTYDFEARVRELKKEEERRKDDQRARKRARKEAPKEVKEDEDEADAALAALGLPSSFGSSKKN